jgi:hypothetical protein
MTEAQSVAIITGSLAAIPGVLSSILGYFNHQGIRVNSSQIIEAKEDIVQVGRQINGRMTEQLELTKQLGVISGVAQEKKDVQHRKDIKTQARLKNK